MSRLSFTLNYYDMFKNIMILAAIIYWIFDIFLK